MGSYRAKETRTYSRDPIECGYRPERAVSIPVCNDRFGERQTHPGKAGQLSCGSRISIETLTRPERPALPNGAVPLGRG
jgi:hypothetical protein